MENSFTIRPGNFLRPKQKPEERGGERFQKILRKTLRAASLLLLAFLFLLGGHWVYAKLLEDPSFQMRKVEVVGCHKVSQETLVSLTKVEGMPNLFSLRLGEMAKRIESHPWIEHVRMRKVFPDKVLIQVEERKPIAILQLEEPYYIDERGVIFSRVEDRDGYNYPYLTGLTRQAMEKSPEETKELITKALELLTLANQDKTVPLEEIAEIHMERKQGLWCIPQRVDLEVRMGWDHFGEKLKRLSLIWSDLGKRGTSAISIDCSDVKRMVVKRPTKREK